MDIIMSKIKSFWEQAASGSMSLIFAAWLTNAAFGQIQRNFDDGNWSRLLGNADNMEVCGLLTYFREHVDGEDLITLPEELSYKTYRIFTSGHGLMTPGKTLFAFRESQEMGMDLSHSIGLDLTKPSILEKPVDHITVQKGIRDGPRQVKSESAALVLMLKSMEKLVEYDTLQDMNPLAETVRTLSAEASMMIQTDIAFGLQALVESYKSFMFGGGDAPIKVNCRLQALKFAGEVKKSISRVQKLRPPQTSHTCECQNCQERVLAKGLRLLEHDVVNFLAEKRFDLYYQAPWVAGTQMLEILSQSTDYGLFLCNRSHYVGSLLHLYNCLRQVSAIAEETIILERLCDMMKQSVFKGRRPDRNFYSSYVLLLGGRLQFDRKKVHKKESTNPYSYDVLEGSSDASFHGRDRTWKMAFPEFMKKTSLSIASQSHFYALHTAKFGFSGCIAGDAWSRFYGTKRGNGRCEDKELAAAINQMYDGSFAKTLSRMERDVGPELEGQFPIARINWMEVYLTCTEVLEKIALAKLQEPASPSLIPDSDGRGILTYGIRFVQTFLDFADEHGSPGRDRRTFPYLGGRSIGYVRDAINEVFKGNRCTLQGSRKMGANCYAQARRLQIIYGRYHRGPVVPTRPGR